MSSHSAGFLIVALKQEIMDRSDALYATTIAGIVLGLAVLLYGESASVQPLVFGGSAVVVLSVGLLTGVIAGLDEPDDATH